MVLLLFYHALSKEVDLEVFAKKVPVNLAGFDAKESLIWSKTKTKKVKFLKKKNVLIINL